MIGQRGHAQFQLFGPQPITRIQVYLDGTLAGEINGTELRDVEGIGFSVPRLADAYQLTLRTLDTRGCSTSTSGTRTVIVE